MLITLGFKIKNINHRLGAGSRQRKEGWQKALPAHLCLY